MKAAASTLVVALLGLGAGSSSFAQAAFKAPSFNSPFKDAGGLMPGGRQAFGEALAERMKDGAERPNMTKPQAASCATPPQIRIPGSSGVCTDYAVGNVSLARYSANFAPIVVIVRQEEKP